MSVICRKAEWKDLPALLEVEHNTMPANCYLAAVSEKFFDPAQGVLFAAEVDGVIAGVAHLAFLCDNAAWLEVLRVTPEYQKKGCGTAIWEESFKICEEKKLSAIRMYTGLTNKVSKGLAERFGLTLTCQTREGVLLAENCKEGRSSGFVQITDPAEAEEAVKKFGLDKAYGGYVCRNRTFFSMGPALYNDLCSHGTLYKNGDSLVDVGARQQLDKGYNLALIGGDIEACANHAKNLMLKSGLPRLVAMVPSANTELIKGLEDQGFVFPESQIIMMEKKFA